MTTRLVTFGWIYWAYVCCYMLRKNFPLVIPSLSAAGVLSVAEAGLVSSAFQTVVGVVKFFGGTYVDGHPNHAKLLCYCLFGAGISSIMLLCIFHSRTAFGGADGAYVSTVALLWSANAVGQALAWPALAQIFLNWFPDPKVRGTWYSLLSTNQNVGSTLAPRIYPLLVAWFGWGVVLYAPASLTIVFATMMFVSLRNCPATTIDDTTPTSKATTTIKKTEEQMSFLKTSSYLFGQPFFVALCCGYAPISVVRIAIATWTPVVCESYGIPLDQSAQLIVSLEFGAFAGSLCAGFISDKIFQGRRGPVMCVFSLLCAPLGWSLASCLDTASKHGISSSDFSFKTIIAIYFAIGFVSFPPHMLTGLVARELSPSNMRSSAGCLVRLSLSLSYIPSSTQLKTSERFSTANCINVGKGGCSIRCRSRWLASPTHVGEMGMDRHAVRDRRVWFCRLRRVRTALLSPRPRGKARNKESEGGLSSFGLRNYKHPNS